LRNSSPIRLHRKEIAMRLCNRLTWCTALLLHAILGTAAGGEPLGPPLPKLTAQQTARLERLIRQLGASDAKSIDAAKEQIKQMGPGVLPRLRRLPPDPLRDRTVQRIIEVLTPRPQAGISMWLTTPRKRFVLGEPVPMDLTIVVRGLASREARAGVVSSAIDPDAFARVSVEMADMKTRTFRWWSPARPSPLQRLGATRPAGADLHPRSARKFSSRCVLGDGRAGADPRYTAAGLLPVGDYAVRLRMPSRIPGGHLVLGARFSVVHNAHSAGLGADAPPRVVVAPRVAFRGVAGCRAQMMLAYGKDRVPKPLHNLFLVVPATATGPPERIHPVAMVRVGERFRGMCSAVIETVFDEVAPGDLSVDSTDRRVWNALAYLPSKRKAGPLSACFHCGTAQYVARYDPEKKSMTVVCVNSRAVKGKRRTIWTQPILQPAMAPTEVWFENGTIWTRGKQGTYAWGPLDGHHVQVKRRRSPPK
jgi:hypothetical protein